jgi:STE24 endopeptidase
MLTTAIVIFSIYFILKLYVSIMQIGYVNQTKRAQPLLMGAADFLKAGNYTVAKEKLSMVGAAIEYVMFIIWMSAGIAWLDNMTMLDSEAQKAVFMVLGFIVINGIITLPMEWYGKFVLDEAYGFNRSTFGLFFKDTIIATVLSLIFGGLVVWGVYAIMTSFELWWLWSFLFIFGVIVLINMLFPTVRALFFDKVTPLDDEELNGKIEAMMQKTGFVSSGVFVSDASKRDARLNAYFGGLGKTKRVVLFDTLLKKLTHQELLAVLGHELGHFAHGDIYKNIALMGGMLFVMFGLFGNLPESLFLEMGIAASPAVVMILFLLFMPVLGFIMMPLMGIVSRHNEYEADRKGAELGGKLYLAEALKKLVTENKSYPISHPVYIFFYYTHPPVLERLKELGYPVQADTQSGLEGPCPTDEQ